MTRRNYEIIDTRTGRPIEDDDDPVLRDGQTLRVPLHMRDGVSPMQREVMADKAARLADDAVAKRFGLSDALDLHRPGPRYCVDAAARAHVEEVYQDEKRKLQDAWRQPVADVRGQQPGDKCTINGAPGHLNAKLECIPDKRQDAAPRMMDAAEAQRIKDEAWLEMCRDLEESWKGPAR
jgi:hypothetical protein